MAHLICKFLFSDFVLKAVLWPANHILFTHSIFGLRPQRERKKQTNKHWAFGPLMAHLICIFLFLNFVLKACLRPNNHILLGLLPANHILFTHSIFGLHPRRGKENKNKNKKQWAFGPLMAHLKVLATIPYFNFHFFPHSLIFLQFRDPSYVLNLSTKAVLQKWHN